MDSTKTPDLYEMIEKFKKLQSLVPYVEEFCIKYRELFPSGNNQAVQQELFSPEMLLEDDQSNKELRSGIGSNVISIMKKFNRPMLPIEIKRVYKKLYMGNASKNEVLKINKNVQQSLLYLMKVKKLLKKNDEGKYELSEENINTSRINQFIVSGPVNDNSL